MERIQQTKKALGSTCILTIVHSDTEIAQNTLKTMWEYLDDFEKRCSRFLLASELNILNRSAGKKQTVSPELQQIVSVAQSYAIKTGGIYNPLILPALQKAGYVGSWPDVTSFDDRLDYRARTTPSAKEIKIKDDWIQLPANSALDLGGIGKGYALDALADIAEKTGCGNYWCSLGGDIIAGGTDSDTTPWIIDIENAYETTPLAGQVQCDGKRMAITTSGILRRTGTNWHHIIDPRTGLPAHTDIMSATVVSGSATEAEIYAKCLIILGSTDCPRFIKQHTLKHVLLQILRNHDTVTIVKTGDVWV
jgi:FAD:protein FMN transferase